MREPRTARTNPIQGRKPGNVETTHGVKTLDCETLCCNKGCAGGACAPLCRRPPPTLQAAAAACSPSTHAWLRLQTPHARFSTCLLRGCAHVHASLRRRRPATAPLRQESKRERGCVPLRLEHAPARTRTNACHDDDGAPRPCARSTARSAHMCTCACCRIMCARRAPAAAPAGQRASAPPSAAAAGSLALAPAPARFATPHRPPDPQSLPVCSSAASASWRRTAAAPPLLARHHAGW